MSDAAAPTRPYRNKPTAASLVARRAGLAGVPFSAMVEIADRCNEACVHCYQVQGEKGELDTAEWESIFRQLSELGVLFLTISGGEPTLRKDFLHLVQYARSLRFAVKIFSNGLLITPALAAELGRLAVQEVQISLYSHLPGVHDGVTRVPGSFDRVVSAVRALRGAGVKVVLKSPLMLLNAPHYSEYVDFVTGLGADYSLDPKLNPRENGDRMPTTLAAGKAEQLALRKDVRFASARGTRELPLDSPPCGACAGNVHIEPNGELRPCTQWSIPTGDARAGSLRETWYENPAAQSIRALTWNDLPACRSCDLRAFCQRCFAEAELHTGDALGPYATACRGARWKYEAARGVAPEIDSESGHCEAQPLGPFLQAGEHRFLVSAPAQAPLGSAPAPGGGAPFRAPFRPWLAAGSAGSAAVSHALVPLRRRDGGPALTGRPAAPSVKEG